MLTCIEGAWCSVYFEPWGTEYALPKGDIFHVRSSAWASGDVEVSYVNGGIILGFYDGAVPIVTTRDGKTLPI